MAVLLDILAAGAIDSSGEALSSGVAYVYTIGTTTKANVFSDRALTAPISNPITLDAAGKAEVYTASAVRVVIEDSSGNQIEDIAEAGSQPSLDGDVILGATSANTLKINSQFTSNLIPQTTGFYDVGSESKSWRHLHLDNQTTDDNGGIFFGGGSTQYIRMNNDGVTLELGAITNVTVPSLTFSNDIDVLGSIGGARHIISVGQQGIVNPGSEYLFAGGSFGVTLGPEMPYPGSILAITGTTDVSAYTSGSGTFQFEVHVNGSNVLATPSFDLTGASSSGSVRTTQALGVDTFVAGDTVEFFVNASGAGFFGTVVTTGMIVVSFDIDG